ncbi:MAG: hypothetical protein V3S14_09095 [Anaerolineae bacterium]
MSTGDLEDQSIAGIAFDDLGIAAAQYYDETRQMALRADLGAFASGWRIGGGAVGDIETTARLTISPF